MILEEQKKYTQAIEILNGNLGTSLYKVESDRKLKSIDLLIKLNDWNSVHPILIDLLTNTAYIFDLFFHYLFLYFYFILFYFILFLLTVIFFFLVQMIGSSTTYYLITFLKFQLKSNFFFFL